jgi:hypothetical protein
VPGVRVDLGVEEGPVGRLPLILSLSLKFLLDEERRLALPA